MKFLLTKETIFERLRIRGEADGNWCFQQTEKCLKAFNDYDFGEYIDTDVLSIDAVAEQIKEKTTTYSLENGGINNE